MDVWRACHLEIIWSVEGIVRLPAIGNLIVTRHSARDDLPVARKGDILRCVVEIEYRIGNAVDMVAGVAIVTKGSGTDKIIGPCRGRLSQVPLLVKICELLRQVPDPEVCTWCKDPLEAQGHRIGEVQIVTCTAGSPGGNRLPRKIVERTVKTYNVSGA
jgi:hypothetical protein